MTVLVSSCLESCRTVTNLFLLTGFSPDIILGSGRVLLCFLLVKKIIIFYKVLLITVNAHEMNTAASVIPRS